MNIHPAPIAWIIAGSDSGGGAGLQADLRAFDAFDVHGCSAVAAVTAQNSMRVQAIEALSPELLDAQLQALADDMPPAAIKTGMLGSVDNLRVVIRWVDRLRATHPGLALVVDPVLRATTGAVLANEALLRAMHDELLPRATVVTPNRAEAAALLGLPPLLAASSVEEAAQAFMALGVQAAVITGGDNGGGTSDDYVASALANGWLSLPRLATPHHHGSGCVFASSTAAALARGFVPTEAVVLAKMATTHALRYGYAAGQGAGPVRPRAGFGLESGNLPVWGEPGKSGEPASLSNLDIGSFAPLADPCLGLYAIVDSAAWVLRVLHGGVRTVQLRIKDANHPQLRGEVRASVVAARAAGAQLFINDHWQVAIEERAYGVHLGQEDLATADLAAIARAGLRLGISTHAYWEVCRAWALRPSYIACGPVHPTQAKAMPWIAQGNANLAYWCRLLPTPVVAIGGMDVPRAAEAMQCGAAGVAVISAITASVNPEAAITDLQRAIVEGSGLPGFDPPGLPQPTLR